MNKAKKTILQSVRAALASVPADEQIGDIAVDRTYRSKGKRTKEEVENLFIERVTDYKATVKEITESGLKHIIAQSCLKQSAEKLVIPHRFPEGWLPGAIEPIFDEPGNPLTHSQLDATDGVITTSAWAIAETGTIVLDAGLGQGRRVCTLLPDYHLCIVKASQIVETVPEGFAKVATKVKDGGAPITFISGPSATSDIELSRVEGVHGPRRLDVIILINS